jgi:starch synthase
MTAEKILFVTQEISPYVPDSELTNLGYNVPNTTIESGREARIFMPKWGNINERRNQLHPVQRISGMNLVVDDTDYQLIIKVASIVGTRMQVYFIDDDDFFGKRLAEHDREGKEYTDNFARSAFYARSVIETVKKMRWTPNIVHCHGWISALAPVYLKMAYAEEPCFRDCRVVYTVAPSQLTLPTGDRAGEIMEYRQANGECFSELGNNLTPTDVIKLAVKFSDGVTFLSPNPEIEAYAREQGKLIMETAPTEENYLNFFDEVWNKDRSAKAED